MRLFLIVILNIFVFCGTSQAKRLSIDIDAALFNRDSVNYQWEMYYTLPDSSQPRRYRWALRLFHNQGS